MLTFDEDGYLTPDEPIEVDFETFIREFVINEHRADIFTEYRQMLLSFARCVLSVDKWEFCYPEGTAQRYRCCNFFEPTNIR